MSENKKEETIEELLIRRQHEPVLEAMKELQGGFDGDLPTIGETFFRLHVLPDLCGESGDVTLSKWMGVAGHPGRSINVFDDSGKNFLFRVPPLMWWNESRFGKTGPESFKSIVERAAHMNTVMPQRVQGDLEYALEQTTAHVKPDAEQAVAIDTILRRYGKTPLLDDETARLAGSLDDGGDTREAVATPAEVVKSTGLGATSNMPSATDFDPV